MTRTAVLPGPSRRARLLSGLAVLASVAIVAVWLLSTSTGALREQLKTLQFWSLEGCVLLGLLLAISVIKTADYQLDRGDYARMAALSAVSVSLTLFAAPRTNRIFYDEQIYQGIGQNLAELRRAQVCNDGSVEYGRLHCASGEYNKQPYGYPHALSVAYRLVGVQRATAFVFNAAVMALTVCGVYLLAWVLFRDRDAALFAGLLIALTPEQLVWSATAAVEPSASLALVTALLCAAHYLRSGGTAALALAAVTAAYAIQFRPESFLVLPVLGYLAWPRLRTDVKHSRTWWGAALFLSLAAVHIAHMFAVRNITWGTTGPRFSLAYVASNLRVNGWFYLYDERFPVLFTLLAIAGVAVAHCRRERLAMAAYFALFFAIGLLFYAGSYNYGADVRYSLMTYPPIAILGGLGAAQLTRLLRRLQSGLPARALVATVLVFQFLWYAPVVRATTEEAWAARADVRFAEAFARELPPNSYVLTHNPSMFHLWGVNAGQMSLITALPEYVTVLERRYTGGIYLHWNFWCNVRDAVQQAICRKAMEIVPGDLIKEQRERDQRYAIYRKKAGN